MERDLPDVRPIATSSAARIVQGFAYPFRAVGFARQHGLLKLVWAPMVIGAVLYVAIVLAMYFWSEDLINWIWTRPDGNSAWGWLTLPIWYLFSLVMWLLALGLGMVLFLAVALVAAAPFNALMSERIVSKLLGTKQPTSGLLRSAAELFYTAWSLFGYLIFFLVVSLGLLLLNLVPVVGSLASLILSGGFTLLMFSLEFLDNPLARQYVRFQDKWKVVWQNRSLSLGFGAAVFTILLVPLAGVFLIPFAHIGGTLMYCEMIHSGLLPRQTQAT